MFWLATLPTLNAQTFAVIHNFTGGGDGEYPAGTIAIDQGENIYGAAGLKVIYELSHKSSGWILDPIYDFTGSPDGYAPNGVVFGPDGALYGTTELGGQPSCLDNAGCGIVFRLRPSAHVCGTVLCPWTDTILYAFNPSLSTDGVEPYSSPTFAQGSIYGTTSLAGLGGAGTVYQLAPSGGGWAETTLYSFMLSGDGGVPSGSLVIDSEGNVYGTASYGGDPNCNCGTIFKLTRSGSQWIETTLHTFESGSDGTQPAGGLIADQNGNLYGTTEYGGQGDGGVAFEFAANGTYSVIANLSQLRSGGIGSVSPLTLDAAGNLYGSTVADGAYGKGSVFKLTKSNGAWTYSSLYSFTNGSDGIEPMTNVVLDSSGNVYGTAQGGSLHNCTGSGCGVVFEITP